MQETMVDNEIGQFNFRKVQKTSLKVAFLDETGFKNSSL